MALEAEKARLRALASRFSELHAKAQKLAHTRPFLIPLGECVGLIATSFQKHLEVRLTLVDAVSGTDPASASRQVQNIESPAGRLLRLLSSCLQSVPETPEELIHFTADSFRRLNLPPFRFVITVADAEHVSMHSLQDLVVQLGFTNSLADFGELFATDERVGKLIVLFLPERMLDRSNSLEWAVIPHEVGHAYLESSEVIHKRFPNFRHLSRKDLRWMIVRDHHDEAIRHAYFTEFACDEIAVRVAGSAYPWRLFSGFFSLGQLTVDGSHPPMDFRVKRSLEIAKRLGFSESADAVRAMLDAEIEQQPAPQGFPKLPTQDELDALSRDLVSEIQSVSMEELVTRCLEHQPSLTIDAARGTLEAGRPLALPGWAILCLATPSETISSSSTHQQAVADSIRLGQINDHLQKLSAKKTL